MARGGMLALVACLVGCGGGTPILVEDWTLQIAGRPDLRVHVPDDLRKALPDRSVPFTLHTRAVIPPELRGRTVSFAMPSAGHHVALFANGREITVELELFPTRRTFGPMRWLLGPPITDSESVDLELRFDGYRFFAWTFDAAPRWSADPNGDVDYLRARIFNEHCALATAALGSFLFVFYGLVFLVERQRREYGWFALGALFTSPVCFWLMGLTGFLGSMELTLLFSRGPLATMAGVEFAHAIYGKRAPPRLLWIAIVAVIVVGIVSPQLVERDRAERLVFYLAMPVAIPLMLYTIGLHAWMLRERAHRFEAAFFLFANVQLLVAVMFTNSAGLGAKLLRGTNLSAVGLFVYAIVLVLVLSRSHAVRMRENRALTDELRQKVADRSRELADALAKLREGTTDSVPPAVGQMIDGRYRVVGMLGRGAMGVVYEAERVADSKRLAIKVIADKVTAQAVARFAREAQLLAQVRHPHLVEVWDVGVESSGRFFLVMELVAGASLNAHRKRFGEVKWALPILGQIARGLEAIHQQGIVHRDLKPGNVLLTSAGAVKIADFGVAAVAPQDRGGTEVESQPLTRTGALLGTPRYMAPELATGARDAQPSADIFGFGVMAYELLTTESPFQVPPIRQRLDGGTAEAAMPLDADGVAADISECLHRCLHLDPTERPTAAEIVSVLSR